MKTLNEEKVIKNSNRKAMIDKIVGFLFLFVCIISASIIIFTIFFIIYEGINPFVNQYTLDDGTIGNQNFWGFLTGLSYGESNYGSLFLVINTLYVTLLSAIISIPVSILTSIFITRIAPKIIGEVFKTGIEILASVPSVIYGLFGMGVICPLVRDLAYGIGIQTSGGLSVISGAIVLAMMSIPTITLVSITSIQSVSKSFIEGSLALGATNSETNFKVVLKGATSGIISGIILGIGRALGEATAVSLVIGNAFSGPTFNIFGISSTLTSIMMLGIGEATGLSYDIRFSLGIMLMLIIVIINLILNYVKNKITNPFKKESKIIANVKDGVIYLKAYFNKNKDNDNEENKDETKDENK